VPGGVGNDPPWHDPACAGNNGPVPPEQRRFLQALVRSLPWVLAAVAVAVGFSVALAAPRWAISILVPCVACAVPLVYTRAERRAMGAAARERGAGAPSRGLRALAAAHLVLPLIGVPLAIEGLRTGDRILALAGTSLLGFVVLDAAVLLPWHTARRQRRERASRAR
jgi:hypothetical protein